MGLQFEIAGNQIDGARDYQEDSFLITHLTDAEGHPAALVIVADGMGGHAAGNVASNIAVQAVNKYICSNYPSDDVTGLLQGGVLKANASIAEVIRETPALEGMGCTMVAVLIEQGHLWWASVGDSHLYLLRDKALTKMNADHSYGGFLDRLAAAGQPMEPEPGLSRNMLMSAITGEDITEIDSPEEPVELEPGDRLLLCSDGIDTLSNGLILQFAEWSESTRDYVQALLDAVEEAAMPRQDNTTAIAIDILPETAAAEKTAAADTPAAETADSHTGNTAEIATMATAEAGDDASIPADTAPEPPTQPSPLTVVTTAWKRWREIASRDNHVIAAIIIAIAMVAVIGYLLMRPDTDRPAPSPPETATAEPEPADDGAAPVTLPEKPATIAEPETATTAKPEPEAVPSPAVEIEPPPPVTAFRDRLRSGGQGPMLVIVPAGAFAMGSSRFNEERPEHRVEVARFAISRYEITVAEYERFARATANPLPTVPGPNRNDQPIVNVSWPQAVEYTTWLSRQTGHQYRLPTEAEWEYAASAGRDTDYWWGVTMEPGRAHCFDCSDGPAPQAPTNVGNFPANPFGLHDMEGNVAEWVLDCWHKNYEDAPSTAVAWTEGGDCSMRVVRGGSYNSPPSSLRNARRDRFRAADRYDNIGFRVVREVNSE